MGFTFLNWQELQAEAANWENPQHLRLLQAEALVCEKPDESVARYRNVNLIPGVLQIINYIDALCRGEQFTPVWINRNYASRLTRQALLKQAKVRQEFLVDEAALTYWPGRFKQPVKPQLVNTLNLLRTDMTEDNLLHFRVIPSTTTLPDTPYDDTFCVYETPDETIGFKEPWAIPDGLHEVTGRELAALKQSWADIGSVALDRHNSLDLLVHTIETLR